MIASQTIIVSLVLGTVITLIASILPAKRATRVPPIAAVREGATLPTTRLAAHSLKAGLAVTLGSIAAISVGIFAGGAGGIAVAALLGGGVLGLFAGIALLAPRLVKPLARVVGWPARRAGGVAGELAGANAVRHPGRTASTAAALMIGLTLVTVVAVLGAGLNASTKQAVSDQVQRRLRHRRQAGPAVQGRRRRPAGRRPGCHGGVARPLGQGARPGQGEHDQRNRPRDDRALLPLHMGRRLRPLERLGTDGALVTEAYAEDKHLALGDHLSLQTPAGDKHTLTIRGIYDPPDAKQLLGDVSMTQQAFDKAFANPKNSLTLLDADPGAAAAIESAAEDLGDATLHTGAAYPKDATKDMATMLAMLYVLLGFSVIVSLFGMVNTMVLSVFERTREIGMLRTIGMTRRQARRMIRHESIITALIGATLGIGLGVFLAALVTQAVGGEGISLVIPYQTLAGFTLVAVLAGIGAAILPARRASRLNVLDALQYE